MAKKFSENDKNWYFDALELLGDSAVTCDRANGTVTYNGAIASDESHVKSADPEELAHAVAIALLHSKKYGYPIDAIGHEIHFAHGSKGSKSDEVDVLIRDADGLPYAMFELKSSKEPLNNYCLAAGRRVLRPMLSQYELSQAVLAV